MRIVSVEPIRVNLVSVSKATTDRSLIGCSEAFDRADVVPVRAASEGIKRRVAWSIE